MYIAAKILLSYFASLTAPDLCDVVNTRTGTPTICMPHADDAPVYNADVCCTGSSCVKAIGSTCVTGQQRFHCELGELNAVGSVSCYFEVPNYCDVYPCELEIGMGPQHASTLCCPNGICTPYAIGAGTCELDDILICESVYDNGDGTVECLDSEE